MKLVFAIKALSVPGGGAERVFVDIANGLHARGHDLQVMTFEPAASGSFYDLDASIPRLDSGVSKITKATQLLSLPRVRSRILAAKPDAVVAFMPSCYVPLAAALVFSGVPFIASEHNVPARYKSQPLSWLSMKAASCFATRFTAVSDQMKRQYPEIVQRKMTVLPNPVDIVADARADVVGTPGQGRIIAVGRLHEQKDHITLIRAFAKLADEFPGWTVRILGDGAERDRLRQEISRHNLDGRVELPGTVRDVGAEYRAAQIYVIPSRYESYGLATIEALAHGLPAVGFADCPGTNELIRDDVNGVLVYPGDDRAGRLADAMKRLMADADARCRLAVGPLDSQEHSLFSILDRWEYLLGDAKWHETGM